jgi:hypothetical protein
MAPGFPEARITHQKNPELPSIVMLYCRTYYAMAPNAGGLLPLLPEVLPARSGVPVGIQTADGHLLAYDPAVGPAARQ